MKSDTELMRDYLDGDQASLGEFYARHRENLARMVARKYCRGDINSGYDYAQDGFIRLIERISEFDIGLPPYPWLMTITIRLAIDGQRRASRMKPLGSAWGPCVMPEAVTEVTDLCVRVQEVVAQIHPRYVPAVTVVYLLGLSYAEAAGRLGIPINTLRTYCRRGLKQLRACFKNAA